MRKGPHVAIENDRLEEYEKPERSQSSKTAFPHQNKHNPDPKGLLFERDEKK